MYVVIVIFKLKLLKANCSAHGSFYTMITNLLKLKFPMMADLQGEGCARDGGSSSLLYFLISNISRKSNFFIRVRRWDVEGWIGEGGSA